MNGIKIKIMKKTKCEYMYVYEYILDLLYQHNNKLAISF